MFFCFTPEDSSDYHALRDNSVVFAFKMEKECINVEIIDDDVLEKVEYFSLQVILDQFQSDLLPNVKLEPNVTFVEILDDDCKCPVIHTVPRLLYDLYEK